MGIDFRAQIVFFYMKKQKIILKVLATDAFLHILICSCRERGDVGVIEMGNVRSVCWDVS